MTDTVATAEDEHLETTGPMPAISVSPDDTAPVSIGQLNAAPAVVDVTARVDADADTGQNTRLSWSARSDVGLVRGHNEDSFLVRVPLFAVCDGMGGHAAGEVASSIAVRTISERTPAHATDTDLGVAVEAANAAVMAGAEQGIGKEGMGCTATAALIEGDKLIIAHVGDSRIYLLSAGMLVRVTHDHSFVEELVDAGEITADEARVHPSRSVITRALGNDPEMYADHFTIDVATHDRIILCSDGLSSMVGDAVIEDIASSTPTAEECTDKLVGAALAEGGHDNITVVTVDVLDDGTEAIHRAERMRALRRWGLILLAIVAACLVTFGIVVSQSWYVADNDGTVGIYQGSPGSFLGMPLSHLSSTTSVEVSDLPVSTQKRLVEGIAESSEEEARETVESYRDQILSDKTKAAENASTAGAATAAESAAQAQSAATAQGGE
ncbi:MAG: Stp1/IreP family PP2C-type Ser/Thr phosphatase [Atopobiaceae bacterium]|jgi:protein phosphatase|nr:Stp1/IreP family PP2C-type Ser/Thr phosphatase [Atopobiaceae bacterium]